MRIRIGSITTALVAAVLFVSCRSESPQAPASTATPATMATEPPAVSTSPTMSEREKAEAESNKIVKEKAKEMIVWANAEPDSGAAPLAVQFTVESLEEGFTNPTYEWDFGDGTPTSSEAAPTHTYAKAGAYTVRVIVKNGDGMLGRDETWVEVE